MVCMWNLRDALPDAGTSPAWKVLSRLDVMTGKYLSTFLKATYVVFMFVGMVYFILIQGYKASFVFAACLTLFYSVLLYTVGKTDTNKTQAI